MSPRTGRPLKGQTKRANRVQLILDDEEKELLDSCVRDTNTNRTSVIIKGIQLVREKLDEKKE